MFSVVDNIEPQHRILYKKSFEGTAMKQNPSKHLNDYLAAQGIFLDKMVEQNKASIAKEGITNETLVKPATTVIETL